VNRLIFSSVVRNEMRQVWRRRSFWIVQGLLFLIPILVALFVFFARDSESLVMGAFIAGYSAPGLGTLALYYLVLPILVGPIILSDLGKVGEILWSGPLDGVTHYAGMFCGLWLALLPAALLQLGGWFLADLFWPNLLPEWVWLVSLAVYLLANTLGLCVTMLLSMLLRRILPVLIGWAALWVWVFSVVSFSESWTEGFNPMQVIAYMNIYFHNLRLSPSLGLGLAQGRVLGMAAWFAGFSLAALCLGLLLSLLADQRRSARREWLAPLLVGLSLVVAAGGYALNRQAITAHAIPPSPLDAQIDVWEVLSQRTEVEVDASNGMISGTSALTLSPGRPPNQPEVVLRLNPGLELTAASDGTGAALSAQRQGDSVVISLPEIPAAPVTLNLAWQGRLQIPYTAFELEWRFHEAPYPYGFTYMPQALQALVQPNGGYLLRDGDWMPWPWTTGPHQADENWLAIRPTGGEAAASVPMRDGAATWEGQIPKGLLVFLPGKQMQVHMIHIDASRLVGVQQMQQANLFASAADRFSLLTLEPAPRYVVVTPYLSDLVWSGELLLIPDGSGYYLSFPLGWLYQMDATGPDQPIVARATLAALVRAWLLNRLPPPWLEFQPRLAPAGETMNVVDLATTPEEDWYTQDGHWVQAVEFFDVKTFWNPRRVVQLTPQGEWSTVAFWLAMEMADDTTRQADLDLIKYFAGEGQSIHSGNQRYALMSGQLWPDVLDTDEGRAMVWNLHAWASQVGTQDAVAIAVTTIQETQPESVMRLMDELERRSGISVPEEQP
jgi:hypothetical protein